MKVNFKIRTVLIVALLALGVIPLLTLTVYSYHKSLQQEFAEIKDHHLLLAKNMASSLSRYERDLRSGVRSVATNLRNGNVTDADRELLTAMHIDRIILANPVSGETILHLKSTTSQQANEISPALFKEVRAYVPVQSLRFTPVNRYREGNFIHLVGRYDGYLVIADVSTRYFVELGKQISFGKRGHAAIVDQKGNVLAHPNKAWTGLARNLEKVPAVQKMMLGQSGIIQFYSPAIQEDVVAGYTTVPNTGWGVMVPFPVSEIYSKVLTNFLPILWGVLIEMMIILLFVYAAIKLLAKPLEKFSLDMLAQFQAGRPAVVPPDNTRTNIVELQNIFSAYNDLAKTIDNNAKELQQRVNIDPITGIGNREYFVSGSEKQIAKRIKLDQTGIVIFLDMDGFKEINDTRGHSVGDAFLTEFAKQLYPATKRIMDEEFRGITGAHPIIGRIGGDEFAICMPLPEKLHDVEGFCRRLHKCLPQTVNVNGITLPCSSSAGGAVYPDQGTTDEDLVRRADVALYHVKANGKSDFGLYKRSCALGGKSEIMAAVIRAIENDELLLEYQPKICVKHQAARSVEALLRWQHPVHGLVPPNSFLPAVQTTQVMERLGEWVIKRAIRDMKLMHQNGYPLSVAVNIGAAHFCDENFAQKLKSRCEAEKFDPKFIQIEVTEDVMDVSEALFCQTVRSVQELGAQVGIDDFGQGYSNLSRLATVPVDVIKLDKSIIGQATTDSRIKVILQSAIDMAHALDARVVVEGVETIQQAHLSEKCGADALQGYYFSKSLRRADLETWLGEQLNKSVYENVVSLDAPMAAVS